jgi:hypothetical protein
MDASMKYHSLAITFLAVAAFSIGCKRSEEQVAAADHREAAAQQFDKVKK